MDQASIESAEEFRAILRRGGTLAAHPDTIKELQDAAPELAAWLEASGIALTHNGSAPGREFFRLFTDAARRHHEAQAAWVARLRAAGVKAAHPNDGWVDRERDTVHFAYATFNDGVGVGDVVALGSPERFRLVRLIGFKRWIVALAPDDGDWMFEPIEEAQEAEGSEWKSSLRNPSARPLLFTVGGADGHG